MPISLTITGLLVSVIAMVAQQSGLDITHTQIESFVYVVVQLGGLVLAWYGRVKAGGITWYGRRENINPVQ